MKITIAERFWSKVNKRDADDCWEWTGGKDSAGYGGFNVNGNVIRAHIFAFNQKYGATPKGHWLVHKCGKRLCCNPTHILAKLPSDARIYGDHYGARTFCVNGHEFNEANTYRRKDINGRQCKQCSCERNIARYRKIRKTVAQKIRNASTQLMKRGASLEEKRKVIKFLLEQFKDKLSESTSLLFLECPFCKIQGSFQNFSLDHDIPVSRGGAHRPENIKMICAKCNTRKGDMTGDEFVKLLAVLETFEDKGQRVLRRLGMASYFNFSSARK